MPPLLRSEEEQFNEDPTETGGPAARARRPWSKTAPPGQSWDAIVIGSGMGGMTTAGLLAKLGKRVLVLEQHYVPGGFTHMFRRKGYAWDVGVHLVGDKALNALPGKLMSLLSDGKLTWASVGPVYDEFFFPDDFSIAFSGDRTTFERTLKEAFPDQTASIDAWFTAIGSTARSLLPWHLSHLVPGALGRWLSGRTVPDLHVTAAERIAELVPDPRLRAVLLAQWGYHGLPPSEVAWVLQAMINNHFLDGASYPVGGASRIATTFLDGVAKAGGWTRIHADVAEIVIEEGRAVGVRMSDGEVIRAPQIVSAAGAWSTVTHLLPASHADRRWAEEVRGLPASPAHVCLYVGFKGDIASAGATRSCQWFYETWDQEQGTWKVEPGQPLPCPPLLFTSYPSLKDPEHKAGEELRHTGELIAFVPWQTFERWRDVPFRERGEDYDVFKKEMGERMLDVMFQHHPKLRDMVAYWELSTPLSTDYFVRPQQGAIYGLAGSSARYANRWLRPQTPIPGLWMAGSDIGSCGVAGALMGGVLCALAMEPRGVLPVLVRAMRSAPS
jgi:all-trans-retinol 13,14-reductase